MLKKSASRRFDVFDGDLATIFNTEFIFLSFLRLPVDHRLSSPLRGYAHGGSGPDVGDGRG